MTSGTRPPRKRLGDLLVGAGVISPAQLEGALALQRQLGMQLGRVLVEKRAITEEGLVLFLSQQLGLGVAVVPDDAPPTLMLLARDEAEKLRVFPLAVLRDARGETLLLAMADPTNADTIDTLQFKTGLRITPLIISETALEGAIRRHYYGERRRDVAAQSPVQFGGTEIDLPSQPDGAPVDDDIPLVTGVLSPPTRAGIVGAGGPFGPAGAFIGSVDPNDAPILELGEGDVIIGRSDSRVVDMGAAAPAVSTVPTEAQFAYGPFGGLAPPRGTPMPSSPDPPPVLASEIGLELVAVATPPPAPRQRAFVPAPEVDSSPWAAAAASASEAVGFEAMPSSLMPPLAPPSAPVTPPMAPSMMPPMPVMTPLPPLPPLAPPPPLAVPSPPAGPVADAPTNVASTEVTMAKPDLASLPYCPDCGATRLSGAKFCPHCGCSFTGVVRAKGKPPAVAPATRPMMPAVAPVRVQGASALGANGALDIEILEGVKPFLTGNVVAFRPRTAPGANVDEPELLVSRDGTGKSDIGLGMTTVATPLISDASAPDEADAMGLATMTSMSQLTTTQGGNKPASPVAPMRLHVVTQAMARVDDADTLGPPLGGAPAARPAAPPRAPPAAAPVRAVSASGGTSAPAGGVDIGAIESQWAARLTSQGGLVDDALALASGGRSAFALGLGVTHLMAVHADAALVDDPAVLVGGKPAPSHITRAVLNGTHGAFGRIDDVDVLAPGAPTAAQALNAKASLAKDWADAAEKMIPRKDDRANVDVVPAKREVFFAPDVAAIPPPPAPEPVVAYVPAAPVTAVPSAPWAAFTTPAGGLPAPPSAPGPAQPGAPDPTKPGFATMMMSLDAVELRALAERLVQKGAVSTDDVDAAKNKK